jgi:hypothetical protein
LGSNDGIGIVEFQEQYFKITNSGSRLNESPSYQIDVGVGPEEYILKLFVLYAIK